MLLQYSNIKNKSSTETTNLIFSCPGLTHCTNPGRIPLPVYGTYYRVGYSCLLGVNKNFQIIFSLKTAGLGGVIILDKTKGKGTGLMLYTI